MEVLELGIKHRNTALLAKWGWKFMMESDSFWGQHGLDSFGWHSSVKRFSSPKSPSAYPKLGKVSRTLLLSILGMVKE